MGSFLSVKLSVGFVLTAVMICGMYRSSEADITAKLRRPAAVVPQAAGAAKQSYLRFVFDLPLEKASSIINQYEFRVTSKSAANAWVQYDAVVTVDKISVAPSGKERFPLELRAPFRFRGRVAGGNHSYSGTATINLGFTVGDQWCPLVEFEEPNVELREDAPIPAQFGFPSMAEFIAKQFLEGELKRQLECKQVKNYISQLWQTVHIPVQLGNSTLFIHIEPQSIAVANLYIEDDRVRFMVDVGATSNVRHKAAKSKRRALPVMPKIVSQPSKPTRDTEIEGTMSVNLGVGFP